ncbi:MAG: hypothetical protein OHK0021_14740 [Bryobacter sp.]
MTFRALRFILLSILLLFAVSCNSSQSEESLRVLGEAFAGPNDLALREDLSLRSQIVTKLKHGERVEVVDRRRRFVRVRTEKGLLGWTDIRQLISRKQLDKIDQVAKIYSKAPSQGGATVFDALNVHIEPNRYSPTFVQIQEKERVEVVGHRVVQRVPYAGEELDLVEINAKKKPAPRKKKKVEVELPSPPNPPALPADWQALSRPNLRDLMTKVLPQDQLKGKATSSSNAVAMDDLSLVRLKDGKVGWVLTNALFLEVPDEVAQYAEGNRIAAYFKVGEVQSAGGKKGHWLWATSSQKYNPYDFDGLRLFTYNARKERYETAFREKGLRGMFPIQVSNSGTSVRFEVRVENESGETLLRRYEFDGSRVKLLAKELLFTPNAAGGVAPLPTSQPVQPKSMWEELKSKLP